MKGLHLYKPLDAAYIQTIANAATWRGKFRSDSIKVKKKKTGYNLFRSSLIAEIKSSSKGEVKTVDITKHNTTIVGGTGDPDEVSNHVELLKSQLEETEDSREDHKTR